MLSFGKYKNESINDVYQKDKKYLQWLNTQPWFKIKFKILHQQTTQQLTENEKPITIDPDTIVVYTDGACVNNGKPNAIAGMGVYFGSNDSRNVSRRIVGKQSNNTAELSAIIEVFSVLEEEIKLGKEIIIYSDSKYSIRWGGEYGAKCEKKNWEKGHPKDSRKKPIPNLELGKKLYLLCKKYPNISLKHIKAHTGLQDEHSLGNNGADELANLSIGNKECPYNKEKLYLNIPFSEKDKGKGLGAKWDKTKKKWFYEGSIEDKDYLKLLELFN